MEFGNIGVFLCSCNKTLNLDFRGIAKELDKLEEVAVVERVESLCTEEGLAYIVDDLRRKDLDKIVVAACSNKNSVFEELGEEMGLDPVGIEIVNIRENCAWVHEDKKGASEKAKLLVRGAVKREHRLPEILDVSVQPSILIAGDLRAVELGDDFADFDVELHLLNDEPYFKRIPSTPAQFKPSHKGSPYGFQEAAFHLNSRILGVSGELGDFTVEIESGRHIDTVKCVDCGACIDVCGQKAITRPADSVSPAIVIGEKCNDCRECLNVCPTDAIVLENSVEDLHVGQIISYLPLQPQEGVYVIDSKDGAATAHGAALKAALNLKGYKKENFIEVDPLKCANHPLMEKNLDITGCSYCQDSCAYYPVSSGRVSEIACQGCGACTTACPQDALDLRLQSFDDLLREVDDTLAAKTRNKIIMFTCSEGGYSTLWAAGQNSMKYPAVLPIIVPCLGNVSETHILRAFDVGADGVLLLGCGSERCMYEKGFSRAGKSAGLAKKVLGFYGIGEGRVRMLSGDPTDPARFVKQASEFAERIKKLGRNSLGNKKPVSLNDLDNRGGRKREVFHALISGFSEKTKITEGKIEGDFPAAILSVDESECTLCGSCTYHCNTGAMRYEGEEILDIYNTHTYCIGCGICEVICPENAITLERALDVGSFISKDERKFEVRIISCSRCGKPIMAAAAMRKLQARLKDKDLKMFDMCQNCIDRETVADLTGAKADEITIFQQGKAPWDS